jgi:serine/threonine-protein kinase
VAGKPAESYLLQGYLLVNGKDERIDEGPIQVVSDPLKTSGTPAIVTGVSCMACHKHGTIPFTDTVREGSAVFADAERHLKRLYPGAKKMGQLVREDEDRFLVACGYGASGPGR